MTAATLNTKEWLECTEAARMLGIGVPATKKFAPRMKIRMRVYPGRRGPLFNRADTEAALARMEAEENARIAAAECDGTQGPPVVRKVNEAARPR